MIAFHEPLMLEGDLMGSLSPFSPGESQCPEQWLLQNPGLVFNVLSAFRDAGADILPAITFGANILKLADHDLAGEHDRFNTRLVALTKKVAPGACIAGGMASAEHLPEPYGPLPYTDLIDTFAEQAIALASAGAEVLSLRGMTSLFEARAAVMGARQARIPILVEMALEDDRTAMGADPLAALICLQELGIAAFGLSAPSPQLLLPVLRRIAPYAGVPLMARPGMTDLAPEEVSRDCWELIGAGAHIMGGGPGATAAHMQELRILMNEFDYASFPPPPPNEDPALRLCDDGQVYLIDEDPAFSAPIDCSCEDLAAAIAQAEAMGADVLLFHLKSCEEAYAFGQSCHLCKTAVCLLADNAEALEWALVYYSGRALVSVGSRVEPEALVTLTRGYGGVLYKG